MKSNKIFTIGAYGCGNRGDDAILQAIIENFSLSDITATCGKEKDIDFLGAKMVRCRLNEGISLKIFFFMIFDSLRMLRILLRSDVLVYGGGSLIHDLTPYNLVFMYFWQFIAQLFRKKVYYFSIGIGPISTETGKKLSRHFLTRAAAVFPRDERGYQICHELGVKNLELTRDAAFMVNRKNQCSGSSLKKENLVSNDYVTVTASQWFSSQNFWKKNSFNFDSQIETLGNALVETIRFLGKRMIFVPTEKRDYLLGEQLRTIINSRDFTVASPELNCKEMAELIENSYMLIGTRMHSIIFASRQGVPFIPLIYDEKVSQLLKLLEMENYAIPLEELSPEVIVNKLNEVEKNYNEIQKNLHKFTSEAGSLIKNSIEIIERRV